MCCNLVFYVEESNMFQRELFFDKIFKKGAAIFMVHLVVLWFEKNIFLTTRTQ